MPDVVFRQFEWDSDKSDECFGRRGFDFHFACRVFSSPNYFEDVDEAHDEFEDRWLRIAPVDGILLTVVYVERGQRLRIISARRATVREKQDYYVRFLS